MIDWSVDRRNITFEQAEGRDPLPAQLQLREVTQELRALLWAIVHDSMENSTDYPTMGGHSYFKGNWKDILYLWHVRREHKFADDFENNANKLISHIKRIFSDGDYLQIFGFIEFVIRHPKCPYQFREAISKAMEVGRAAYRIQDKSVIPVASQAEAGAVVAAFESLNEAQFKGAREHLLHAGEALTAGNWSDSVRESIHAVESVLMVLEPTAGSLSKALGKLESRKRIHPSLKAGFGSLYGFTSDEDGIRHPLIDAPVADVDEVDALYMFGACASFVSYLIGKSKWSG